MKKTIAISALALVLGACDAGNSTDAPELVKVDGSSTVFPVTEAMAEEFQVAESGATQVTVGVSGTGGGFKKFCRGETDATGASRPIKESEVALCEKNGIEYVELPVALDALTVVVNPGNTWVDYLTVEELRTMWEPDAQGKITNWNQIRPSFPDRPLNLYGAGTDSGTYDYFVEAVVGGKSTRGDFTASEDDNMLVQGVASDVNALGFFGLAYYEENQDRLKAVPISWKGRDPVPPSAETARSGTYQPLARPIFMYVNAESLEQKPHVERFIEFYLNPEIAEELVKEVGYVPLPLEAYKMANQKVDARQTGTVFEGAEVGVGVEDLLKRQPK
jgi:phosphate transport system substrate-binding protein